jgi:hypothetical protein
VMPTPNRRCRQTNEYRTIMGKAYYIKWWQDGGHGQKHDDKMCWIAKAAVKKSGQVVCKRRHCLLTDHNGDVPNGHAWWACTPLRQWCDRIPILAIPILAILILVIHPNFGDPSQSGSWF